MQGHLPGIASNLEGSVKMRSQIGPEGFEGQTNEAAQPPTALEGNAESNKESQLKSGATADEQSRFVLKGGTVGGESTIGCLGAYFRNDGTLEAIYPPCDLNRLGVVVGDKILLVNGKKFPGARKFRQQCVGFPGTIINLVILHDGEPRSYEVQRISSRQLVPYGDLFRGYASKSVSW
jgi:S1-C subfamily serine protease